MAYSNLAFAVDASSNSDRALELIQTSLVKTEALLRDCTTSEDREKIESYMASFYINLATIQCNKGKNEIQWEENTQIRQRSGRGAGDDMGGEFQSFNMPAVTSICSIQPTCLISG